MDSFIFIRLSPTRVSRERASKLLPKIAQGFFTSIACYEEYVRTRMHAYLSLYFTTSENLPLLTQSSFAVDGRGGDRLPAKGFAAASTFQSLAALCVQAKLDEKAVIQGPMAESLAGVVDDVRENSAKGKWAKTMFSAPTNSGRDHFFLTAIQKANKNVVSLDTNFLPAHAIKILWDNEEVEDEVKLRRLYEALCELFRRSTRKGKKVTLHERTATQCTSHDVIFDVAKSAFDTPHVAAKSLLSCIIDRAAHSLEQPITVGFSGGLLQAMMVDAVRHSPLRRRIDPRVEIRALSLNRMFWPDWRIERSADYLACEFAKIMSTGRRVELPPNTNQQKAHDDFRKVVLECDIFVVSGGARDQSFVSSFLTKQCGAKLPPQIVGDFIGHPIDNDGKSLRDSQIQRLLEPFSCYPTLEDLDVIARTQRARIIFVVDPVRDGKVQQPSKAPLVRAVLRRRWVSQVVLSQALFKEVR